MKFKFECHVLLFAKPGNPTRNPEDSGHPRPILAWDRLRRSISLQIPITHFLGISFGKCCYWI